MTRDDDEKKMTRTDDDSVLEWEVWPADCRGDRVACEPCCVEKSALSTFQLKTERTQNYGLRSPASAHPHPLMRTSSQGRSSASSATDTASVLAKPRRAHGRSRMPFGSRMVVSASLPPLMRKHRQKPSQWDRFRNGSHFKMGMGKNRPFKWVHIAIYLF